MKKSLKTKIGVTIIVFGFIFPVFSLIIPFLNLSKELTATLIAFFMVGGPELFIIIGGAIAGKEGVVFVKNWIKRLLGLPEGRYPASKIQYNIGLTLIVIWFLLRIILGYVPQIMEMYFVKDNLLWISIGVDTVFLVAVFGFGGHQMITKIVALFKWENWELPPEENK